MIDANGYRANIGIILSNSIGQVLWAKRINQDAWQFPQGGLNEDEEPEAALFRELNEEIGLKPEDVTILGHTRHWLRYRLPKRLIRDTKPVCIGQKQRWYLLKLDSPDSKVCLDECQKPEFDDWRWVSYWYPLRRVISFKREVYRKALRELAPILYGEPNRNGWRRKPLPHLLEG